MHTCKEKPRVMYKTNSIVKVFRGITKLTLNSFEEFLVCTILASQNFKGLSWNYTSKSILVQLEMPPVCEYIRTLLWGVGKWFVNMYQVTYIKFCKIDGLIGLWLS